MSGTLWPVSVKAVVVESARVLLCLNGRGEWELPGGRLEEGEDLERCVEREVKEETGLHRASEAAFVPVHDLDRIDLAAGYRPVIDMVAGAG